jgi:hypothetical protein
MKRRVVFHVGWVFHFHMMRFHMIMQHDGMLVLVMKVVFILHTTTMYPVVEELKTFYRI